MDTNEFDFVNDIDWSRIAERAGVRLALEDVTPHWTGGPEILDGYDHPLTDGRTLRAWEDGRWEVID